MDVNEVRSRYGSAEMFKSTDVGLIPETWSVGGIGDVADTSSGTTPSRAAYDRYYRGGHVAWVKTLDLNNGDIRITEEKVTAAALTETSLRVYPPGSVLVAMYGGLNQIGRTGLLRIPAAVNQALTAIRPRNGRVHPDYLLRVLNHRVDYWRSVASSSRKDPNITGKDVRAFSLALPHIGEQQAIAEALADADALIESLSLLLAKKRQIKQGAMQELFTGNKRLPEFSGAWVTRQLNQLADIRSGGTPNTAQNQFWNGDILWCTPTDITALNGRKYLSDTARRITLLGMHASSAELIPRGSVVMTSRATIGECAINTAAVTTNQGFKSLVPFENVDPEYLYYLLQTKRAEFIRLCGGSTFLEIGKAQLSAFEVFVPVEKDEQSAISRVLSEMDEGIATLEGRLTKANRLKQGMMQALLTGRIRLVPPASSVISLPIKPAAARPPPSPPAHNWQINEAVVIGVLSQRFGSDKFPLPRKRRVKLMYLLHRHVEGRADGYLKKAAGPYDPNTRYKGPEAIALKNGYVRALRNGTDEGFVAGDKADQAQRYFEQWYGTDTLDWLERFHYRKTDDLELLATVDMAIVDLAAAGQPADVTGVKRVIAANPDWVPKLSRAVFSDEHIARAIAECATLFAA